MNTYDNLNLKNFIDFYYKINSVELPSRKWISEELNMSEGTLRTIIDTFINCNYIYKTGRRYNVYLPKKKFKKPLKVIENDLFYIYNSLDYSITFSKQVFNKLLPDFQIDTIEDLIYVLFSFTMKLKVTIHPKIIVKNNEIWFRKECRSYKDEQVVFMCEFTEHKMGMSLTND